MKQAMTGRDRTIIQEYETPQDGIVAWRYFVNKYCYDGNVDIYLVQQQKVLLVCFHASFPGGAIQFLEDYESAFMNIEYVLRTQPFTTAHQRPYLYTNEGKRNLFVQNFTVIGLTAELIESVDSVTSTWEGMVDDLHKCLAHRTIHDQTLAAS